MTNADKVVEFHSAYGLPMPSRPTWFLPGRDKLRVECIREEFEDELIPAVESEDLVETVDALVDILYFTYGSLIELGVDADAAFAEVHKANMSKLGSDGKPIYREDGKVMKGPNYSPPNIARFVEGMEMST